METTPFRAYQAGTQPPYDAPAYGSTHKRHPQVGLVRLLHTVTEISGRHLDGLIAAFNPLEGRAIIVPTRRGKRGNPVLWSKQFFPEMTGLVGDVGAKHLISEHAELVAEVEMDDDAVLVDIDTPEALVKFRERQKPMTEAAC